MAGAEGRVEEGRIRLGVVGVMEERTEWKGGGRSPGQGDYVNSYRSLGV